jgi:hypothetical protein
MKLLQFCFHFLVATDLREIGWAQEDQWWAVVNTVMNFRVL